MSDADTAASGTIASAAPALPTISLPSLPALPSQSEPDWLPKRLEQAKRSAADEMLKALGLDSLDAAKAVITKAKELEDSKKSEIQRLQEEKSKLEPEAKRATDLAAVVAKYADAELAKLTEEQRAAVAAIAGDDKARTLATVEALRPTWIKAAPIPVQPPTPATTAASTAAPAGAAIPTLNHKATWESLKQSNPMLAAHYLVAHAADIYPPQ